MYMVHVHVCIKDGINVCVDDHSAHALKHQYIIYKYKNNWIKLMGEVGMAVQKRIQTRVT